MDGGTGKHQFLGMQELRIGVLSVAQQGVIEALNGPQKDSVLRAGYVGYIGSIEDLYSPVRLPRSG